MKFFAFYHHRYILSHIKYSAKETYEVFFITLIFVILTGCDGGTNTIVEIALHPTKPHILYVATNEYIYKTRDEGKTWENISRGMSHSRVICLAIDPLLPANVYAGTKGDAVYKSYDGGQRWTSQRSGLDNVTITSVVHQLMFMPGSSSHLFAATSMGVFESKNSGQTWIKRMEGMLEVLMVITLDFDPNQPQSAYAGTSGGVFKSIDGGQTWRKINNGLVPDEVLKSSRALGVTRIKVDPHIHNTVYITTLNGAYKTSDGGRIWMRVGESLPDQMLSDLALDFFTPNTLYVSNRKGIYKSMDGGQTWEGMNQGLGNLNIRALMISPQDSQTLYAGTNRSGLFRSRDAGRMWEPVSLTPRTS